MGGLGNQIFQIFATISYSIESGNKFKFLNLKQLGGGQITIRNTYWDTFLSRLKFCLIPTIPHVSVIREKEFTYNEISIFDLKTDVLLHGYFQSYKYFEKHYQVLCRLIGIETMKQTLLEKLELKQKDLNKSISIHFRLGDYKKLPEHHPIMQYSYYHNSLKYLKENIVNINDISENFNVYYFCEDEDIEDVTLIITKLTEDFPNYTFLRAFNTLYDWEQLLLMSMCKYNIIANSSFSWWGAYFNSNPDKIVCYPSIWFGESSNNNTKDLFPLEWIKIYSY